MEECTLSRLAMIIRLIIKTVFFFVRYESYASSGNFFLFLFIYLINYKEQEEQEEEEFLMSLITPETLSHSFLLPY